MKTKCTISPDWEPTCFCLYFTLNLYNFFEITWNILDIEVWVDRPSLTTKSKQIVGKLNNFSYELFLSKLLLGPIARPLDAVSGNGSCWTQPKICLKYFSFLRTIFTSPFICQSFHDIMGGNSKRSSESCQSLPQVSTHSKEYRRNKTYR